jgi:hypothetical protein
MLIAYISWTVATRLPDPQALHQLVLPMLIYRFCNTVICVMSVTLQVLCWLSCPAWLLSSLFWTCPTAGACRGLP